jgi:hypothetical protein
MRRTKQTAGLALLVVVCVTFATVVSVALWRRNVQPDPTAHDGSTGTTTSSPLDAPSKDDQLRKLVVGTWQDEYQGKRKLILREDGTGTMVVELSGLKATLVARRLTFNMEWSIANGRLKKRSLGGEPSAQVNMILKTMGDTVDEPILDLTEGHLMLLDRDGKTKYEWRRVR